MWVHAERSPLVSIDDGVCNLCTCFCISAGGVNPQHLSAHRHILSDGGRVLTALKDRRVVIYVQDRNADGSEGGEAARGAAVGGSGSECVERLELTVKGAT